MSLLFRDWVQCSRFMHSGSFKTSGFTVRSILRVPGTSIRSRTLPKWIPVFGKQDRPFGLKHRHFILPASITLQRFASAPSITLPIMSLTPPTATLAEFLQNQKSRYLKDVEEGKGGEWTVVMGNEAGGIPPFFASHDHFSHVNRP